MARTIAKKQDGRRTYYPSRVFDDHLVALVALFKKNGWSFSGVDSAQLQQDALDQRKERGQYDALDAEYERLHQQFGQAQELRYLRYSAALNAVRGAFRNDKTIVAQLKKFKDARSRSARTSRKSAARVSPKPVSTT